MSALLFDLDGVIITFEKNFAETYSEEFGVPLGEIYQFFSNDYFDCAIGRRDLPDALEKYRAEWKWPGDVNSLIDYWFKCQSNIDRRMISLIQAASRAGHRCFLASDQDVTRCAYIRRILDVDSLFNQCFFSCEVEATKTQSLFFEKVIGAVDSDPANIFYWDDNIQNVKTAESVGLNALLFTSFEEFEAPFSRFTRR